MVRQIVFLTMKSYYFAYVVSKVPKTNPQKCTQKNDVGSKNNN